MHVTASGLTPENQPGPLGVDLYFPLSVWLRDSSGRWHASARPGTRRAPITRSGCGSCPSGPRHRLDQRGRHRAIR